MLDYTGSRVVRTCRARSVERAFRPVIEHLERRALLSAGQLDPTFGTGGIVSTDFGVTRNSAGILAAAVQTDGKTVVTGYAALDSPDPNAPPTTDFPIVRYTTTGSLDPTFGQGGVVYVPASQFGHDGSAIALQSDGKILVAAAITVGTKAYDAVFRYTSSGAPDATFGSGGRVLTDFGATSLDEMPTSLAVRPDGRILLAGQSSVNRVAARTVLASYLPNGQLDPSFGTAGKVIISTGPASGGAASMALQSDGKIDICGTSGSDWYVARLNANGSFDSSFGSGGTVVTDFAGKADHANSLVYEPGGDIVVAGSATVGSVEYSALAFYTPTGTLDTTRGSAGKVTTSFGVPGFQVASDSAASVALQADGKMVVGAKVWRSSNVAPVSNFDGWGVARYNRDGSLDATFATGGKTVTTNRVNVPYGDTPLQGMALGLDGKIVLAGGMSGRVGGTFLLQRYQADARASVSGSVFNDLNANGFRDAGEGGLAGRTVYLDVGNDGQYSPADPSAVTDTAGNFTFTNLSPNQDYVVRQLLPYSWAQTTPANSVGIQVHLTPGQRAILPAFGAVGGQLIVLGNSSITTLQGDEAYPDQLPTGGTVGDASYSLSDKSLVVQVHHQLPGAVNWAADTRGFLTFVPTVDVQYSFMAYGTVSPTAGSPARAGIYLSSSLGSEFNEGDVSTGGSEIHFDHTGMLHAGTTYTLRLEETTQGMPAGSTDAVDVEFALYLSRVTSTPFMGHPVNIASDTIQAENFDDGGEGVAYHDCDARNTLGAYRNSGVDVGAVAGASNGFAVGYTYPGEWLAYSIQAPTTASYVLQARVANYKPGGTFHVTIDGIADPGSMTVPDTGPWDTWQTITSQPFWVTAGTHVMKVVMDRGGYWGNIGDFDSFQFVLSAPGPSPFLGDPFNINTDTIEAENFDNGGEDHGYHDTTPQNIPGQYRNTGVDVCALANASNGFAVGYTYPGEWLSYTINAPAQGTYTFQAGVANFKQGGTFHVAIDGIDVTGAMTVPDTGPWDTWQTLSSRPFTVAPGNHQMKVYMDRGGYWGNIADFDYFKFLPATATPSPYLGHPFAVGTDTIEAENFDNGGEGVAYHDTTAQNLGGSSYRNTAVDINSGGSNGYDIGHTAPGEWLSYSITNPAAGTFAVGASVASFKPGGKFHVEVDGQSVTGPMTVPDTGGWYTFQPIVSRPFALSAGNHTMRVVMDSGGYWGAIGNFDYFVFAPAGVVTLVSQNREIDYATEAADGTFQDHTIQTAAGDFGPFDQSVDLTDPTVGAHAAGVHQASRLDVATTGAHFQASGLASQRRGAAVGGRTSFRVEFDVGSAVPYSLNYAFGYNPSATPPPNGGLSFTGPSGTISLQPAPVIGGGLISGGTLQAGRYSIAAATAYPLVDFSLTLGIGSSAMPPTPGA